MLRYLALGDSYTIGEGVAPEECWPNQMVALLRDQGSEFADPDIIAQTGWTTDELSSAMERRAPQGPYDLVSLLIGANDNYRGRSVAEYGNEFGRLLGAAIALAGDRPGRVLVLSIPDWGVTPFACDRDRAAITRSVDDFNAAARSQVEPAGAMWLDITAFSRAAPNAVVSDGLHPTADQYTRWAQAAAHLVMGSGGDAGSAEGGRKRNP